MLRSKDSPDGCPGLMYQSVALSVLSCFTGDLEIMTNASVLFNLPVLLDIINDSDNEIYEENLLIINDAYEVRNVLSLSSSFQPKMSISRSSQPSCAQTRAEIRSSAIGGCTLSAKSPSDRASSPKKPSHSSFPC